MMMKSFFVVTALIAAASSAEAQSYNWNSRRVVVDPPTAAQRAAADEEARRQEKARDAAGNTSGASTLHGADTRMLVGIDHECAADPEHARWALLGICRADQQNQNGARRNGAAHDPFKPRLGRPGSMFVNATQPASGVFTLERKGPNSTFDPLC
jgi:hypothetical protein